MGDAFTEHGVIGKIFGNSFSFKLQKWFLHQNAVEFNQKYKSDMCNVWMGAGRQKTWENMLIYLKSVFLAMTPSSPSVQWSSGAGVALAARQLFKYVSKVINQDADLIIPSSAAPAATDPHCGLARLVPAGLNAVILYKFSSPRLRPRCSFCLLPSEGDNSQQKAASHNLDRKMSAWPVRQHVTRSCS